MKMLSSQILCHCLVGFIFVMGWAEFSGLNCQQTYYSPMTLGLPQRFQDNIIFLANPEPLYEIMMDNWPVAITNGSVKYDPAKHPMDLIAINSNIIGYNLLFASGRASKPSPVVEKVYGRIYRPRNAALDVAVTQELSCINYDFFNRLYSREILATNGFNKCRWNVKNLPTDGWLRSSGFCVWECARLRELWRQYPSEINPFQTVEAYESNMFANLISQHPDQTCKKYCLMVNAFPIYAPHFLLTSTVPEKPQCIASHDELMDLLMLQKYFSSKGTKFQINFNSNNAGSTIGGASVSVWHCQIADLQLGDSAKFLTSSGVYLYDGDVKVCEYEHLKTTHHVFLGSEIWFLADAVFKYISILHTANNAYNLSLSMDEDGLFRVLLTIRGDWYKKSQNLQVQHFGTPAFAECAGSWIFTVEDEYRYIKNILDEQGPREVIKIIQSWQEAASQDLDIVSKFDEEFFRR